jgi:hypothetical protein
MVDIPSISAIVATVGGLGAVLFADLQLRDFVKTRRAQFFMSIYELGINKDFGELALKALNLEYKDYDDFVNKYGPPFSDNPAQLAFNVLCMYNEAIGILVKKKMLDIELVSELMSVDLFWGKVKPIVEGMRKQFNQPAIYEWFEYLFTEFIKYRSARASK